MQAESWARWKVSILYVTSVTYHGTKGFKFHFSTDFSSVQIS